MFHIGRSSGDRGFFVFVYSHMEKEIKYPKDIKGKEVKVGDKVKGFGSLKFQDGWSIDRSPTVTVNIQEGVLYFGNLSASSFTEGFQIVEQAI